MVKELIITSRNINYTGRPINTGSVLSLPLSLTNRKKTDNMNGMMSLNIIISS